jgi:outer membrane immunogenic protein
MIRNLLLGSVALTASASMVFAADLPTKKGPPPAPVAAPYSWTGFDVGVQAGYGWGNENDDLSLSQFFRAPDDHFSAHGAIGGAHVGYDQQLGSLVLGVRGELDASGLRGTATSSLTTYPSYSSSCASEGCTITDASLAFRNTWQAFLLGRAGVAFDRLLVYAVGGLALGDDRENVAVTQTRYGTGGSQIGIPQTWTGSQTNTLVGGAIGLGAEYAFDKHWTFGAEWRYVDFARGDYSASSGGFNTVRYKAGFSENLAIFDVGYHF